ncbi:hypothetical protein EDB89DRAFT_2070764 [Lactarius sanguifluus]|nr:hypothetical protein EDB89DRAFT_2070764 [Lactarius sanguifluus]
MHSHKTLALLALAASTASPALSAPVLEARASAAGAASAGSGIGSILKTIGSGLAFGALPVVLQDALGGNNTRRDPASIVVDGFPVSVGGVVPDDDDTTPAPTPQIIVDGRPVDIHATPIDPRGIGSAFTGLLDKVSTSGSIGKVLGDGLLGGVASGAGAIGVGELLNLTRREPSPLSVPDLSSIGKTVLGAGTSLAAADAIKGLFDRRDADLIRVLQLIRRDLDERGGIGSAFSSLLNSIKTTDSLGSVIGNGLLGGVASGVGAAGANGVLDNTRRDGESHALVGNGVPPQLTAKDLISAFNIVARRLAELD